jgi:UDP-glucose 4-epimerase
MTVLITGGAGYIGSHAVYHMIEAGHEVVVVDNLQTGFREALHPEATFYEGDLRDRGFLDALFARERIEGVLHFAANSLVGESMEKPLAYFENNVHGTGVLLEAMVAAGIDKIVFSSTAAVYGDAGGDPLTEELVTEPINAYGETKRVMERMMHWAHVAHDLNYVSLRYFNVAGAHRDGTIGESHDPETHLIPILLQVPTGRREIFGIFGDDYDTPDGTCIRDYIHIEDLVRAHALALDYLVGGGTPEIFNLGTGTGYSILEMLEAARAVTGHPIPAKVQARRAGDPAILVASAEKAKRVLGWEPEHKNVREIIQSAWAFYEKYPDGFKGLSR